MLTLNMAAARLPAIVKLSGSFAAGGLLYAELHTGAVDGAWLPFLKSLLSPKEAQALSLPYLKIKTAPPPPRMKPWIALDEAGKCVKVTCLLHLPFLQYCGLSEHRTLCHVPLVKMYQLQFEWSLVCPGVPIRAQASELLVSIQGFQPSRRHMQRVSIFSTRSPYTGFTVSEEQRLP
jgi:hypothetical protein